MNEKSYPADQVVPLRGKTKAILLGMEIGRAINFHIEKRKHFNVVIYRLHYSNQGRWKTVAIGNDMFAVIRLE